MPSDSYIHTTNKYNINEDNTRSLSEAQSFTKPERHRCILGK